MYLKMLPPDGGIYAGTTGRQANHMRNHGFILLCHIVWT